MVRLDRCVWSCNTPNDLFNKICVQKKKKKKTKKTGDLNLSVVNMITGISDTKRLTIHVLYEYTFDGRNVNLLVENVIKFKSGIMINTDQSWKIIKYLKKVYIWNPSTYSLKVAHI